jgi:hypothetical protein
MSQQDPWSPNSSDVGDDDGSSDTPDYGSSDTPDYGAPPPYATPPQWAASAPQWAAPAPQYGAPPPYAMSVPMYGAPQPASPPDIGTPPAAAGPPPDIGTPPPDSPSSAGAQPGAPPSGDAAPPAAPAGDGAPADHEFADSGGAPADLLALVPTTDGQQLRLTRSFVRRLAARPQWELARWIRLSPGEHPFRAIAQALRRLARAARVGRCSCNGCAQCTCAQSPMFVARFGNGAYRLLTRNRGMGPELVGLQLSTPAGLQPLG